MSFIDVVQLAVNLVAIVVGAMIINGGYIIMSEAMDRLRTEVEETKTATASALALIAGLATQIRENAEDPAALNALADSLDEDQASIAEAITSGTAAAPVADDEPTQE